VVAVEGTLRARWGGRAWQRGAGVLTAPDVEHAIDARGAEVLLVFLDPESDAGAAMRATVEGDARVVTSVERDGLAPGVVDPLAIMRGGGVDWARGAAAVLGGQKLAARRVHPRVRRLLRHMHALPAGGDTSLEALAEVAGLSSGRLMHAFTESVGIPLRPYVAWLRLQRAAAGVVSGVPLARAAADAGFADSAHMTRAFRRMFGLTPSALREAARGAA
jgi:AraC-like DNA-binding protein